jgi:hypothetical protein
VAAAAPSSFATKSSWVTPAMTRCTRLVDKLAMRFCAVDQAASCPLPAVRTTRACRRSHPGRPLAPPRPPPGGTRRSCAKRSWGGVAGPDRLPGPRRQAGDGELGVQAAQTQSSRGRHQGRDPAQVVVGAPVARRCCRWVRRRRRCGGVHQHHGGDLVGVASGEGEHLPAAEGMAGQHIGSGNLAALQQPVEVGGDLRAVLGG